MKYEIRAHRTMIVQKRRSIHTAYGNAKVLLAIDRMTQMLQPALRNDSVTSTTMQLHGCLRRRTTAE